MVADLVPDQALVVADLDPGKLLLCKAQILFRFCHLLALGVYSAGHTAVQSIILSNRSLHSFSTSHAAAYKHHQLLAELLAEMAVQQWP